MGHSQGELFPRIQPEVPQVGPPPPPPPAQPSVLTLVDASGLIFRAYHALPALTSSKGVPTHAVLGFTRMVLKLLRERRPSHLALCFDKDSRRGRQQIDPAYKANREGPPPDLVTQFGLIRKMAAVLNLPLLEVEGWEADDVIATLVDRARARGFKVEIITSDKDFLQLLADDVVIYDPLKDQDIDEAVARARFGVAPSQMRDYQALVGDPIDNVPKVPGIGPKTAVELLDQFGSVEALLERLDQVSRPKTRQALADHADQLRRALNLVTFRHDLPLEVDLAQLARRDIDMAAARALFTELEFFRLMGEMPAPPPTPLRQEATMVADRAGVLRLAEALGRASGASLAPAFLGEPHSAALVGLGVMVGEGEAGCWYVDIEACGAEVVREVLGPALGRPGLALAAHDGKALLQVLHSVGAEVRVAADLQLLSYLLNPSRKEHALSDLARERLRTELPSLTDLNTPALEAGPSGSSARLASALGAAADAIHRLAPELWTEIEGVGLGRIARELELPLVPVLAKMERAGVLIDRAALAEVAAQVDSACTVMLAKVYELAGHEFNVGSPQQLAKVLFDELKLPVLRKTKSGASTDHEVLEKLAEEHPLPRAIIEYRNVAKLKSTYLDTLPALIGVDGRVRTTFNQAAAATGRLSSTNPNLQNIPIRTELGRQIRRAFVAQPEWVLVSADYSQVELRILAHVSADEALMRAFADEADVHARTAAEIFAVPEAEVTAEQRRSAKMVNYGIAYGLSPHGLATRLNIPAEEARSIIERYFERFPGIHRYIEDTVEKARRNGFVESLAGRRRYMPDLVSRNRSVSMAAERAAINMPIQGTAADLIKAAMLRLDQRFLAEGLRSRMLLQVHDELLFEAPEAEVGRLTALAREVMSGVGELKVPLVVDVGVGHSWADAH